MILLTNPNPLKNFKSCLRIERLVVLTLENNSMGFEERRVKGKSPRAGPCLKNQEDRGVV